MLLHSISQTEGGTRMDWKLIKENIPMERLVARGQSQMVVEGEMTLPGGLREEARVLHAGGWALVDTVEAMQDRASVSGKVSFYALYTQGDPTKINVIEATADLAHTLEMTGLQPRSQCRVEAVVEHVDASVSGGRLTMRAVVKLSGRALSMQPMETLTGIADSDAVEIATRRLKIRRTVAEGYGEMLLREEFSLPEGLQIRETLQATARPQLQEVTGGLGRAGVTGQIQIEVTHASTLPGKPLVITRHSIPVDEAVELKGEDGDTLDGRLIIRDVAVASQEAECGERLLRAEVLLGVRAWSDRREELTVLEDAYTTEGEDLRLAGETVRCRVDDHWLQAAESGKLMLMLPEGAAAIRSVLGAFAVPAVTGREQIGGRLNVEGMLEITLLYMTEDSAAPVSVHLEEPFRATFAASVGAEDFLTLQVTDVDVSAITSDRIEMKYILHMSAEVLETEDAHLVTDATPVSTEPLDSGIVLYFTQPGEGLWDIARRYRVPMKAVRGLNPELGDELRPGQGVVVWRKSV